MTRIAALLAAAAALIGLAAAGAYVWHASATDPFADCRRGTVAGGAAAIGGAFSLTSETGARVTDRDVITRPTLVYFGYGFCPDVCPTDLARNALAADLLAERGDGVGLVFVSIDPERDTPEIVADFTAAIHPDLVGLTGSPEDVAVAAKAYKVFYRKSGEDPEAYLMDHSTFTYLVDPTLGFLDFFSSDAPAEAVAEGVGCYLDRL